MWGGTVYGLTYGGDPYGCWRHLKWKDTLVVAETGSGTYVGDGGGWGRVYIDSGGGWTGT